MQTGLHIGLLAWLHANCDGHGFAAWPAIPVQTALARLESAQNGADMARVAEFARMVNFVALRGQPAHPFDATTLWQTHARTLSDMIFAERAWSSQEDDDFQRARAVLYDTSMGGIISPPSEAYMLYQEHANAHGELVASGGSTAQIASAMTGWILNGYKTEIEAAEATISRLALRSSLPLATADRVRIDMMLPVDPTGMPYAMTSFSPMTATCDAGWLSAQVDLAAIEPFLERDAAGKRAWRSWVSKRKGIVTFEYAILTVHREWFTDVIYSAEDWTLDGPSVSDGAGTEGKLAAIPNRVFLVREAQLRLDPPQPQPAQQPAQQPALRPRPTMQLGSLADRKITATRHPVLTVQTSRSAAIAARARPARVPPPRVPNKSLKSRKPIVSPVQVLSPKVRQTASMRMIAQPTSSAVRLAHLRPAMIEKIDPVKIDTRLSLAHRLIAARATGVQASQTSQPDRTIWVVGFGCDPLPEAPNPHPNYRWPASVNT
jgi:hypothetical protein